MNYLYENKIIPIELNDYIQRTPILHRYFEQCFNGIKIKNYCGFLYINNQAYFIIPKIVDTTTQNLNIFIYMLSYSYDINLKNETISSSKTEKNQLFEIFIKLFSDGLLEQLKKGIFKTYITQEKNLKVLRGKYVVEKNFSNFYHQNIYCEFDEFSMDNELNRFFFYAIKTFQKFSSYKNLYRCEAILDEVQNIHFDIKNLTIDFNRLNTRYEQSYKITLMLLKKLIPLAETSKEQSFAFLFDMAEVFEKFVGKLYIEIDSSTQLQHSKKFGNLYLKPDIITSTIIIDTKYKKIDSRSDLSVQDKYQMFTYGINFQKKNTMLLYPKYLFDIDEQLRLGEGDNLIKLQMKSLDLEFDGGYSDFIREMKKRTERII